jgi:hypothetical protein
VNHLHPFWFGRLNLTRLFHEQHSDSNAAQEKGNAWSDAKREKPSGSIFRMAQPEGFFYIDTGMLSFEPLSMGDYFFFLT